MLEYYSNRRVKIGAFSAASNVTGMHYCIVLNTAIHIYQSIGILTAVDDISIIIHKAGGIVFFDYATAAPYVKV